MSPFSRREFMALAGAVPLAATAVGQQRTVPVGLEMYSVRTDLTADLLGTTLAVCKMGYQAVEYYAPYLEWTPAMARAVRNVLDDNGVRCNSTHNNAPSFTPDGLKKAIELNQILGSRAIIMASAPRATGIADWKMLGDQLTVVAEALRPLGMWTGYHNHQVEWRLVEGQRPMDVLATSTPHDVILQFDVGTCVEVGADPVAWIKANPGRIRSVHCKDWGAGAGRGYAVAFGEGDAPWKAIFDAAESVGGVEYYLIEQENPTDQLSMVRRCLENYKKLR